MRYFYVIVQITSIAHNNMLFVLSKPFVFVNVVLRSNSVVLKVPGTSCFCYFFYHVLKVLNT